MTALLVTLFLSLFAPALLLVLAALAAESEPQPRPIPTTGNAPKSWPARYVEGYGGGLGRN